jgi:hypothetical protein
MDHLIYSRERLHYSLYSVVPGGGERENTPLTGAYASNPAVTAFRVSSRVVAASESEDPTYSSGTGKLKDK